MTFDQANDYIENKKKNKYQDQNFNNLTNPRIKNFLRALSANMS